MAKAYGKTPSDLVGVVGVPGYHLNRAVLHFGEAFEAALQNSQIVPKGQKANAGQQKAAADRVTAEWLQDDSLRRFRDPFKR